MTSIIVNTVFTVFRVIEIMALVSIIMSWVMPFSKARATIDYLLSPLLLPFRKLNMKLTAKLQIPLDFSYMFLLMAMEIAKALIIRIVYMI